MWSTPTHTSTIKGVRPPFSSIRSNMDVWSLSPTPSSVTLSALLFVSNPCRPVRHGFGTRLPQTSYGETGRLFLKSRLTIGNNIDFSRWLREGNRNREDGSFSSTYDRLPTSSSWIGERRFCLDREGPRFRGLFDRTRR